VKDYHSTHAVTYEPPGRYSYAYVPVLPFLTGQKWDEHALAFVHSLRPTYIRVTRGGEKCDARTWRVTVTVDENEVIKSIRQEVEIGLSEDWQNGNDAMVWMRSIKVA
jgi:hypothetical protein